MADITVLVVDDDHFVQQTLASLVDRAPGLVCVGCCSNGAEAVEFVAAHPVDVVIMDVRMPVMDGFDVCRAVKENPRTKDAKILMISGALDETAVEWAMLCGAEDTLQKPFDGEELLDKITEMATRAG